MHPLTHTPAQPKSSILSNGNFSPPLALNGAESQGRNRTSQQSSTADVLVSGQHFSTLSPVDMHFPLSRPPLSLSWHFFLSSCFFPPTLNWFLTQRAPDLKAQVSLSARDWFASHAGQDSWSSFLRLTSQTRNSL